MRFSRIRGKARDRFVAECLAAVSELVKRHNAGRADSPPDDPRLYCSFCAAIVSQRLRRLGVPALFQAGSAGWRMVSEKNDDGVSPTMFWHEFNPAEAVPKILQGVFPELHCWVVVPDTDGPDSEFTLIDVTTKALPDKARMQGFEWKTDPPPDYLWANPNGFAQMPDDWYYRPSVEGIRTALHFLKLASRL